MNQYYLYKKNRRDYVPVEDEAINNQAKVKLEKLLSDESISIPDRYRQLNGNLALFSSTGDIEKANSLFIVNENTTYDLSNRLNELTSKEWLPETVTVFAQKGLGAGSKEADIERQHPAPYSFQDVARLIRFFTKTGDVVLDPFNGVGSTLKACALERRKGIGIELNKKYYELSIQRMQIEVPDSNDYKTDQKIINGNSIQEIKRIRKDSIDFIVTSPPYWNILETIDHKVKQTRVSKNLDVKYSEDKDDLANIEDYNEFIKRLASLFNDCHRILKDGKHMAIVVSDFRKKNKYYIFHADLANAIEKLGGFQLKGIRILYQRHKSIFPYGYPFSFVPNMHHQNVLIFQKINSEE